MSNESASLTVVKLHAVLTLGTGQRRNVPGLGTNIVNDGTFEPRDLE
jgi:hypothetical protein